MSFLDLFTKPIVIEYSHTPLGRFRNIIEAIKLSGFRYGVELKIVQDHNYYWLIGLMKVLDRDSRQSVDLQGGRVLETSMSDDEVVALAFGVIEELVTHELKEMFIYKGQRVFDPHRKEEIQMHGRPQKVEIPI